MMKSFYDLYLINCSLQVEYKRLRLAAHETHKLSRMFALAETQQVLQTASTWRPQCEPTCAISCHAYRPVMKSDMSNIL